MCNEKKALAYIPYGGWWTTPFARWQGSLSNLHSLRFAAFTARSFFTDRGVDPQIVEFATLGTTVPQKSCFYGLPWLMSMVGADNVAGPTIAQACATGIRLLAVSSDEIYRGDAEVCLAIAADRISNGPHLLYPTPRGPGGTNSTENWVLDNFSCDPSAGISMIETAENVARENGITTDEQHEVTLQRYEQYCMALADDQVFQKRYMRLPLQIPNGSFSKSVGELKGDEGVKPSTIEGLAQLKPIIDGGTVTYGGQTHPADGNAGIILTNKKRAVDLSSDNSIEVKIIGFGQARERIGYMPAAPVPAARKALSAAGLSISDISAVKTHNPFVVNDIYLSRSLGIDQSIINNYGSPLIWGHPQGPTALRCVIELIEELAIRGGGYGLFAGCAAGDTGMAVILHVDDVS